MLAKAVVLFLLPAVVAAADPAAPVPGVGDETRKAVIALLRHNRLKYGDDAAIMQGLLLVHANQGDAILATESAIVGYEESEARRYVVFRVASGAIYDDTTMNREQRLERVWHKILERALLRYPTFSVPGDGIAVEISYNHRAYQSTYHLQRTIDQEGAVERAKFYLLASDVTAFIERQVGGRELLRRSRVLLDEQSVKVEIEDFVGPHAAGLLPER